MKLETSWKRFVLVITVGVTLLAIQAHPAVGDEIAVGKKIRIQA